MSPDTNDIERIARRVAELIEDAAGPSPTRYVDAAALARTLGVERSWVYAHADELGRCGLVDPVGGCASISRTCGDGYRPREPASRGKQCGNRDDRRARP